MSGGNNEPHLLVREVAEILNVTGDTVRAYIAAGLLHAIDVRLPSSFRASWRIPRESLAKFEAERAGPRPKAKRRRRKTKAKTDHFPQYDG